MQDSGNFYPLFTAVINIPSWQVRGFTPTCRERQGRAIGMLE
jgi:hypothetical protein